MSSGGGPDPLAPAVSPPREEGADDEARRVHAAVGAGDIHTHALIGIGYRGYGLARPLPEFASWNPLRNIFGLVDVARARQGGLRLLVFTSYVFPRWFGGLFAGGAAGGSSPERATFAMVAAFERFVARHALEVERAREPEDLPRIHAAGKIAAFLAVEGGHALGTARPLSMLEWLRGEGCAYLTLTHFLNNAISTSATDPFRGARGLTPLGREVVRKMGELGILVDVTHCSAAARRETADLLPPGAPILYSHTGLARFWKAARATTDEELRRVKERGGLVGILLAPLYLTGRVFRGDVASVADCVDHICQVTGSPDHAAIGSDFDSGLAPPTGIRDHRDFPAITAELLRRGYGADALRKIWWGNFARVLARARGRRLEPGGGADGADPAARHDPAGVLR